MESLDAREFAPIWKISKAVKTKRLKQNLIVHTLELERCNYRIRLYSFRSRFASDDGPKLPSWSRIRDSGRMNQCLNFQSCPCVNVSLDSARPLFSSSSRFDCLCCQFLLTSRWTIGAWMAIWSSSHSVTCQIFSHFHCRQIRFRVHASFQHRSLQWLCLESETTELDNSKNYVESKLRILEIKTHFWIFAWTWRREQIQPAFVVVLRLRIIRRYLIDDFNVANFIHSNKMLFPTFVNNKTFRREILFRITTHVEVKALSRHSNNILKLR